MREAGECCVRMDELQAAAGKVIARTTGAETGIVTSGAAAALTLGAAACLARFDVNRMNRLPDTTGMPDQFIVHRAHRNDYDHAVRAAGAKFVEVGFDYYTFAYEIEAALTDPNRRLLLSGRGRSRRAPFGRVRFDRSSPRASRAGRCRCRNALPPPT